MLKSTKAIQLGIVLHTLRGQIWLLIVLLQIGQTIDLGKKFKSKHIK